MKTASVTCRTRPHPTVRPVDRQEISRAARDNTDETDDPIKARARLGSTSCSATAKVVITAITPTMSIRIRRSSLGSWSVDCRLAIGGRLQHLTLEPGSLLRRSTEDIEASDDILTVDVTHARPTPTPRKRSERVKVGNLARQLSDMRICSLWFRYPTRYEPLTDLSLHLHRMQLLSNEPTTIFSL